VPATVVLFTSALFFSGYAIQQRTLRDLRAAIRQPPPPPPKIFLPDRFKSTTTELEDGTIVVIEEAMSRESRRPPKEQVVIEVKPSIQESPSDTEASSTDSDEYTRASKFEPWKASAQRTIAMSKSADGTTVFGPAPKPISKAERRRRIKEEIRKLSEADKPMLYQRRLY